MAAKIFSAAVLVLVASLAAAQDGGPQTVDEANALVDLEQKNVERLEKLTARGVVSAAELNQGRQKLAAVRLQRAELQKDTEQIIAEVKVLVELRQAIYDATEQLFARGVSSAADRDEALRLLHDTQARLAMEQHDTPAAIKHLSAVVKLDQNAIERIQRLADRGAVTIAEVQSVMRRAETSQKLLASLQQQAEKD